MSNTIYVIGAGAIGKALAVSLVTAGKNCVLVRATVADGDPGIESVALLVNDEQRVAQQIETYPLLYLKKFQGPVIIASKSYGNEFLAESLRPRTNDFPIVLLQNGLGVERPFLQRQYPHLMRGVLFITSQLVDGCIRLKPVSPSLIGTVRGEDAGHVVNLLHTTTFPFEVTGDLPRQVWKKAIANIVFNSVCPLIETDNGIFCRSEPARALAQVLIDECTAVAHRSGIALSADELMSTVMIISRASDGQLISTLQDIKARRPTEIDTLNLEMARIASEAGIPEVTRITQMLGRMIKLKATY